MARCAPERGIGGAKPRVEARVGRRARARSAPAARTRRLRDVDARVLQQRGDVIGRRCPSRRPGNRGGRGARGRRAPAAKTGWANDSRAASRSRAPRQPAQRCRATAPDEGRARRRRRACAAAGTSRAAVRPRSSSRRDRRAAGDTRRPPRPAASPAALDMQLGEQLRRRRVALSDRRRRLDRQDLVAEILDEQQPGVAVGGEDLRRRKAAGAQRRATCATNGARPRRDARSRCRACRSARRAVGPRRRDHQDVARALGSSRS